MKYRLPKPRITRQQEAYDRLTESVHRAIKQSGPDSDAETVWLTMRAEGHTLSQSTFNSRLKVLVETGRVIKKELRYNVYSYNVSQH